MQFLLTGLLAAVAVAAPQPARHHHHNNRPTPTPTPTPRPTPQSTIPDYVQIVGKFWPILKIKVEKSSKLIRNCA